MSESNNGPAPDVVLVVDDEVLVRMVIADYLRKCGYQVVEAASADEALLILQHPSVSIDIVFSDIEMPGVMDGFELSKWLKINRPDVDVILTGTVSRAAKAASDLCESGPLPKPYEPQLAVDRIRRLLAARAASRTRAASRKR